MPDDAPSPAMSIGTLARQAGVNVETIRFYQRRGLLAQPPRPYGGIRRYQTSDEERVTFIKSAQRLGFSLDEIRGLLRLEDGTHCQEARELAAAKLDLVHARLRDLRSMERALRRLIRECGTGRGRMQCPLIASLRRGLRGGHAPRGNRRRPERTQAGVDV